MSDNQYDEFLQDAIMKLHDAWQMADGRKLDTDELQDLNDALDKFFEGIRFNIGIGE